MQDLACRFLSLQALRQAFFQIATLGGFVPERLPGGSKLGFEKIYALDADYDTFNDAPADVRDRFYRTNFLDLMGTAAAALAA